jgi:hypothetical protein
LAALFQGEHPQVDHQVSEIAALQVNNNILHITVEADLFDD